jgi:hypothetical protein
VLCADPFTGGLAVLPAEADWVGKVTGQLSESDFPLVNLGCQTVAFRTVEQPWLQEAIFGPLEAAGRQVVHVDLRDAPGVDLVADVMSDEGMGAIKALEPRTFLCSNLLEHVADPRLFLTTLAKTVPQGGHLIVTGPHRYPYHPDPIDNLFRPAAEQMSRMLSDGFETLEWCEVSGGRFGRHFAVQHGRTRLAMRLAMPFYHPSRWMDLARWLPREISSFCVHGVRS